MGIEDGTTSYNLERGFSYHCKDVGGDTEASFILLREPDYFNLKHSMRIQQMTTKVMMEMSNNENIVQAGVEIEPLHTQKLSDAEEMAEAMGIGIMISESVDAGDFVKLWVDMASNPKARNPIAMIEGKYGLTSVHIERMHPNDILNAALRWASFFAMSNLIKSGESEGQSDSLSGPTEQ